MLSFTRTTLCAVLLAAVIAVPAVAQSAANADPFPWEGEVAGMNVYVRSGAGSNWYPTAKLNTGDRVLVLGEKYGWYAILPTKNSFSYIDMAKVERKGNAKTATVTAGKVHVRAGSLLGSRKTSTQLTLVKGDTVRIIGVKDGFFKILPPRGAKLFMSKQYVTPVPERLRTGMAQRYLASQKPRPVTKKPVNKQPTVQLAQADLPSGKPISATRTVEQTPGVAPSALTGTTPTPKRTTNPPRDQDNLPLVVDPTIQSLQEQAKVGTGKPLPPMAKDGKNAANVKKPTAVQEPRPAEKTLPTTGCYQAVLDALEGELTEMFRQPLIKQDITALRSRYEEVANQTEERIPSEIAKIRIRQLTDRLDLQSARASVINETEEIAALRAKLTTERMEIKRRQSEAALAKFDLEGELLRSHAFAPQKRRYRLVNAVSRRTIAYVDIPASLGTKTDFLIGRRVGIHTTGQRFSPAARVPIAVASAITEIPVSRAVTKTTVPSKAENKSGQPAKSTAVAAHPDEE